MRTALAQVFVLLVAGASPPSDPPSHFLNETRENVFLDGTRVGFLRTTVQETGNEGHLKAVTELDLSFRRYKTPVHVRREYGNEETSDGRVFSVFMKQLQDNGLQMTLTGTAADGRLNVSVNGSRRGSPRWSDDVTGLAKQERLFAERRPKPGERFSFLRYEPTFNTVLTVRVTVKEPETPAGENRKLLRVELKPDPLEAPGIHVQPPVSTIWLDEAFVPVRREMELDGIGTAILVRTTTNGPIVAPPPPGKTVDIGLRALVPLNRRIDRPHATQSAVYRVTLKDEPATALVQDGHQEIRNIHGHTFELYVHPVQPLPAATAGPAAAEYLAPSYYLDSDNIHIRDLARRIAGDQINTRAKALQIEHWVHQSMHPDDSVAFVPASQVARDLRGDCRAYAMLTTALCRAAGIPARTAFGLIYVERGGSGPQLGFHMWTEVCLSGRWIGLDGTLGQGGIGACHLKIADHSWYAIRSLTPLLPVNRVLGKITVEVVSVDGGK